MMKGDSFLDFTDRAYRELLALLNMMGYSFTDYHRYQEHPRCVILRHDIDTSLEQAVRMAELEAELGVRSTYFVLLRTDFYNPASRKSREQLRRLLALGHEIGLHFDEVSYGKALTKEETVQNIVKECNLLSALLETPVSTVSMHRPSKTTLEANLEIPGIVNSYGQTFFHDFKYLSDSRRRWREPVLDIVRSGEYDRLHILTHAFWYHQQDESISETVEAFVNGGNMARYNTMQENIADLPSIMQKSEVR